MILIFEDISIYLLINWISAVLTVICILSCRKCYHSTLCFCPYNIYWWNSVDLFYGWEPIYLIFFSTIPSYSISFFIVLFFSQANGKDFILIEMFDILSFYNKRMRKENIKFVVIIISYGVRVNVSYLVLLLLFLIYSWPKTAY